MSDLDSTGVRAVITLMGLLVLGAVSIVIAKIMQYCMKDQYTDGLQDGISEATREIIRARLSVMQSRQKEMQKSKRTSALNIFKKWHEIVTNRKKDKVDVLDKQGSDCVEKVPIKDDDNNKITENGNDAQESCTPQKIARFPSFAQNNVNGGTVTKLFSVTPRMLPPKIVIESPVPRGRPVSSKSRAQANVTLTNVETINPANVPQKTVQFGIDTNDENQRVAKETKVDIETIGQNGEVKVDLSVET